jgi:hypothetical protein
MISSCRTLALLRMDPRLGYIDTASALLEPDGTLRDDVFIFDGLHMNATGYAAWTEVVRPVIESAYRRLSPPIAADHQRRRSNAPRNRALYLAGPTLIVGKRFGRPTVTLARVSPGSAASFDLT